MRAHTLQPERTLIMREKSQKERKEEKVKRKESRR